MLRCQFSRGVLTVRLDLRGFSSIFRVIAVGLVDIASFGMHPASPFQPILLRQRLQVPL